MIKIKKINRKKLKKFVIAGSMIGIIATSIGAIDVYDHSIDHTKEICPITEVLNILPSFTFNSKPFGLDHQIKRMKEDYKKKGIDDVVIKYVEESHEEKKYDRTEPIVTTDKSGNEILSAPEGFELYTDNDGYTIARKEFKYIVSDGYVLKSMWGNVDYNKYTDEYSYEKSEILKLK